MTTLKNLSTLVKNCDLKIDLDLVELAEELPGLLAPLSVGLEVIALSGGVWNPESSDVLFLATHFCCCFDLG